MTYKLNPFTGKLDTSDGPQGPAGVVSAAGPGSQGTPSISFAADLDTGLYNYTPNGIAVSTGGTGRLFIDSSGRVGLGTSSPGSYDFDGPTVLAVANTAGSSTLAVVSDAASFGHIAFADGTSSTARYSGLLKYDHSTDSLEIRTAATPAVTIDSSQRVGIGITVPSSLLSLGGSATAQKLLVYEDGANSRYGFGIQPGEMRSFAASSGVLTFGHVSTSDATTYSEKARIDSSGRLGLGTSSPSSQLHINPASDDNFTNGLRVSRAAEANQYGIFNYSGGALNIIATDSTVNANPITRFYRSTNGSTVNESMRIDGSGNVGIGTTSVNADLHVSNTAGDSEIRITANAANQGILRFGNQVDQTLASIRFDSIDDSFRFYGLNDAERLRITSTGALNFVGAGTAGSTQAVSFNGSAPVNSLVIDSSGRVGLGTSAPGYKVDIAASSGTNRLRLINSGTSAADQSSLQLDAGASDYVLYAKGDENKLFVYDANAAANRIAIDSSGNVGIGTTTPGTYSANLAVYSAGGGFSSVLHSNASGSFPKASAIALGSDAVTYTYSTNGGTVAVTGSAHIAAIQSASSGAGTDIAFINTSGGSVSEKARIDSSGRLLVGTSSESAGVAASFQGSSSSASGPGIVSIKTGTTNPTSGNILGYLQFRDAASQNGAQIIAVADGNWATGDGPTRLVFSTTADSASSPTPRMTIKNGGEVCIGTTDVHVANRNAFENATTGQLSFRHSGTTAGRYNIVGMNSGSAFIVSDSSGTTGVQLAYSGTSWSTLSDERFKTDLEPIESGLSKVATLRALTGRLVTDPEDKRRSFLIAQDVDAVLPEAVDKTDPEALALSYTEVVPLLVAALKESKERIEQLEAKVASLEGA